MNNARLRPVWVGLLGVWLVSLTLPVATISMCGRDDSMGTGMDMLSSGWLGPLIGQFAWLANPLLFFVALLALFGKLNGVGRGKIFGAVLILLAVNALFWSHWSGEGCDDVRITAYHAGYWLWILTIVLAGAFAIWQDYAAGRPSERKEEI